MKNIDLSPLMFYATVCVSSYCLGGKEALGIANVVFSCIYFATLFLKK